MSLKSVMKEENQEIRLNKLLWFARKLFIAGAVISVITILLTVVVKAGAYKILSIKTPFFQVLIIIYCIVSFVFLGVSYLLRKVNVNHEKHFYRWIYFYDLYDFFMKCICVLTLIMVYAFSFVIVDGPSMMPTYSDNDVLIVRTVGYSPTKNDVVIINMERSNELYIKRIVAGPNDVVKYEDNTIYVNDEVVVKKEFGHWGLNENIVTLKEDEYFIIGDNYSNSLDSRYFGPVKGKDILAKVIYKMF